MTTLFRKKVVALAMKILPTIKDIKIKDEDVDTITLQLILQNGIRFSKKFYKYDFDYHKKWKDKKSGDSVKLQVKASRVIDII